jgi:hypothetical protein
MTHHPPMPDASTSPYPLHPAPLAATHGDDKPAEQEADEGTDNATGANPPILKPKQMLGLGAAVGIGSAAIVAALLYAGRDDAQGDKHNAGDDKGKRGRADRSRVAGGEPYEVHYFARKHGITADEARGIIARAGPDRDEANRLAERKVKADIPVT